MSAECKSILGSNARAHDRRYRFTFIESKRKKKKKKFERDEEKIVKDDFVDVRNFIRPFTRARIEARVIRFEDDLNFSRRSILLMLRE